MGIPAMKIHTLLLLSGLVGLLMGCGSDRPNSSAENNGDVAPAARNATASGNATAEEVARQTRGNVKCPAKINAAASAGVPVADVLGVRPGMSWDDAAHVVMCTHDLLVVQPDTSRRFSINTYGQTIRQGFGARFAKPRVERTSQQIMADLQQSAMDRGNNTVRQDVQPGEAKWYVSTMGVPGAERVIAVAREEWFEEGGNPTVASVEQALLQKYGKPTSNARGGYADRPVWEMRWAYDPQGRLIGETSPLYNMCHGVSDPDAATSFSPDCGIVVAATITPLPSNAALSRYVRVGVVDQSNGYSAITGTEQALQRMDAQRRARETEDAARNTKAPQF
jgi:YD repeat-containing protein